MIRWNEITPQGSQEVIPGEHQALARDPHTNKSNQQTECLKTQTQQNYYIRQAQFPDCSTTTWRAPYQHTLLLPSCQKLLHRIWRVLSFTIATIFIHLHQMSCTAPSSAKDLVVFDDYSLSSFCFSCPTPHEAGKGPAVCFWHNHTKQDSILNTIQPTHMGVRSIFLLVVWTTMSLEKWLYPFNPE